MDAAEQLLVEGAVADVTLMEEMQVPPPWDMFAVNLTEGPANQLVGILARLS